MTTHSKPVCPPGADFAVTDNHSTGLREQSRYIGRSFQNSEFDVTYHGGRVEKYMHVETGDFSNLSHSNFNCLGFHLAVSATAVSAYAAAAFCFAASAVASACTAVGLTSALLST